MRFGKHIGKGLWAFADKALPAIYGIGFILLVIRVLPENEYGAFVVVQSIYMIVSALGSSLALQPLTKFGAETKENGEYIVAALSILTAFFASVSALLFLGGGTLISMLLPSDGGMVVSLLGYVPLLLFSGLFRNFAVALLQTSYAVARIFWIDAVYFLGTLGLIAWAGLAGRFSTASELLLLITLGQLLSTILAAALSWRALSVRKAFSAAAFRQMWHFGKYSFGGSSVYTLFSQMDIFFISSYVGVAGVAVYSAAKIFTRIFDMVSQVAQMFLIPYASKAYRDGALESMRITAEKAICFSTILLLPVFLVMIFLPGPVMHLLYNGKYDHGTLVVQIFGVLALVIPWNVVLANYIVGIGKAKETFYYALVFLLAGAVSLYALTGRFGVAGAAAAYVGSFGFFTLLLFLFIQRFFTLTGGNVLVRTRDFWVFVRESLDRLHF